MVINYSLRDITYALKHSGDADTQSDIRDLFVNSSSETVDGFWYNDTIYFIIHEQIVAFLVKHCQCERPILIYHKITRFITSFTIIGTGQAQKHDNKNLKI